MSASPHPGSGQARVPRDRRASVAVDLGAESCRVSLLRWRDEGPKIRLVHRFANGPVRREDGTLRWPLDSILRGVDEGMRQCAALAEEGIRSVAVDGWAVDYVRIDARGEPLGEPFCYRDERHRAAFAEVHRRISPERLRELTGVQHLPLNTLHQLVADRQMDLPGGAQWLNLPEYLLHRWGGEAVAEYTNATHTELVDFRGRSWSREIFEAAGLPLSRAPKIVPPGTHLGKLSGPLAELPAFRDTELLSPACHDTSSAIAGIPDPGDDWAYISSGTWSLVGTLLREALVSSSADASEFTNLGAVGGRVCFHTSVNGLWLLKQCMDAWSEADGAWEIAALLQAAEREPEPSALLDVDDPELLLVGRMPQRINAQQRQRGLAPLDESSAGAPVLAALLFYSLASRYASAIHSIESLTGKSFRQIYVVGGGSRNELLRRITAQKTGLPVIAGAAESSTIGNLAVQLASLEGNDPSSSEEFGAEVAKWAGCITQTGAGVIAAVRK